MMQQNYPFEQIKEYFLQKNEVVLVIVFGSFAQKKQNQHSDIDIAIVEKNESIDYQKMLEYTAELSILLNRSIDLVNLSKIEGVFLHQILTLGITLKNNQNSKAPFAQKSLDFISDYYPIYKRDQNIRLKKMFGIPNK